jgi:hypothetical protein
MKGARMSYKRRAILLISAILLLPASTAFAQQSSTWFGNSADGQWLVGVKLGQIENNDAGSFDDLDNYTVVLGYQFARAIGGDGTASIEGEFGDSDDADFASHVPGSQWEARTIGLYMSYRTPGTVYFKGKLGILYSDLGFDDVLPDQSDTNFAYGGGFGILLGREQNFNIELEWLGTSGDNDLNLLNLVGLARF